MNWNIYCYCNKPIIENSMKLIEMDKNIIICFGVILFFIILILLWFLRYRLMKRIENNPLLKLKREIENKKGVDT